MMNSTHGKIGLPFIKNINKQYETTEDLEHDDAHGNGNAVDGGLRK